VSWERLFVYGASGHGKVVADVVQRAGLAGLVGFIDDREETIGTRLLDLPVVGTGEWLVREARAGGVAVIVAIGDNSVRERVTARCRSAGVEIATAVHPTATVARSATLGAGTVVMAGAAVNPDAVVGEGVIVNTGAIVEHDVVVGDYAHLSPNAATGGAARVGARAHLGLGAVVLPGISVGDDTWVGAGAAVIRDLPAGVIAVGVPARVIRSRS
jgi:UDP-N-acetylbacillosamine N-acetyltransferase/acetyltransferase EpsM